MDDSGSQVSKKRGRTIRIFFPFLLLVLILASIYITRQWLAYEPAGGITNTTPSSSSDIVVDDQRIPDSTIVLPTPTTRKVTTRDPQSTPTATAALPADATIQLSGPPPGSSFYLSDPLNIYWSWPIELSEDQQFAIYLMAEQKKYLAGVILEPALGNHGYQLNFDPRDVVEEEGTYQIQVHLERRGVPNTVAESAPRAISLVLLAGS